jgi:hypothetical protein
MPERAGDREGAQALAQQAADHGNTNVLVGLAEVRERAGEREGAEALARRLADYGTTGTAFAFVEKAIIVAFAEFRRDGTARSKSDVKALPFRWHRPLLGDSSVEHHSHTLPHMSHAPNGLTPDW